MSADPDDKDEMVGYVFAALWLIANAAPFILAILLASALNQSNL